MTNGVLPTPIGSDDWTCNVFLQPSETTYKINAVNGARLLVREKLTAAEVRAFRPAKAWAPRPRTLAAVLAPDVAEMLR